MLMDDLRGRFLPEFLNRIDDIIIFHGLTEDDLSQIVDHLLDQSKRRVLGQGMTAGGHRRGQEAARRPRPPAGVRRAAAAAHDPGRTRQPDRVDCCWAARRTPGTPSSPTSVNDTLHCTVRKGEGARSGEPGNDGNEEPAGERDGAAHDGTEDS